MAASIPFDRIADRYDASRGGDERARHMATSLVPWMPPGPVVELGVGTGLVAAAVEELGRPVVGVDLSRPMLDLAAGRLPRRLVLGDVLAPPVRPASVAAVLAVHILHLVGDLPAAVASAASLLRPGGRLLVAGLDNREGADDMAAVDRGVSTRLRPFPPPKAADILVALPPGIEVLHDGHMPRRTFEQTPLESAHLLETRAWSWCWDLPDDVWEAELVPVIAAMRALPEPERPRTRWVEFRYLVLERA